MYNTGTVTTTANSTKVTGTNTKWKDNNSLVSAEQVILIQNGTTVYINSIASIQSDTELTLSFAAPAAVKNGTYRILTTMVNSISDAANKLVAMNNANAVFSEVLNRMFTETGIITVVLPDGTTLKTKTFAEMDKRLDGKFDKTGGSVEGGLSATGAIQTSGGQVTAHTAGGVGAQLDSRGDIAKIRSRNKNGTWFDHSIPETSGTLMQVGDYGWGGLGLELKQSTAEMESYLKNSSTASQIFRNTVNTSSYSDVWSPLIYAKTGGTWFSVSVSYQSGIMKIGYGDGSSSTSAIMYNTKNTTKDSNGNLKAASPVVKLFSDDIELNDESEGVEMEHLGVGHYLIKGVVGFNADGAWGINNGFVIPQDHNGKNMVLIDYEVRPDGDIEVFVFHQQNADMPERFQNKRIKHFDEEGVPVYFENYEPCDVPESRWIDMRVEMPPNSTYNQKQAEAQRLAKLEAERLAQEEAKRAAEEAERAEQEAAEQMEKQ
ncbi:hypothetical protein [Providencia hangzhouensis]|uniref:Phage tail protein C-terminal domain-containing protein n=1 Tax=Providencia hangzhouensis TaxID=3031799 RepID=A0ABY9ZEA4_9GAMM|nr:hypothetical protein [Providencia hangzhouensis]WNK25941.1 hypothetical protein PZ638_08765 [Providencia hangzhouensis]